jgi:PAS domain S-box-containing protein
MAERIFNIRESEALGRHLLEVIRNDKLFELFKLIKDHSDEKVYKKYQDIELESDSGISYFRVSVKPIKIGIGQPNGMVALIQDITKLKEVDKLKSEFISTVSHEFRTPLTSITMAVGLLLEEIPGDLTEKQREFVLAIKEDSERLNTLVAELLDLSRLESGKLHLDFEKHKINESVDYVIKAFKIQCDDIGATINNKLPDTLNDVRVDINKITWVLSNLVGNAIRYIPKDGSGIIEINVKEVFGKQIVSVKDNGTGISENVQKHIFDKFVQGNDKSGGAGLGLAICKEIIIAHGGDIWVESEPDQGTTFFFTVNTVQGGNF